MSRKGEAIGVCKYALGGTESEAVGIVVRVSASSRRGVREDKNEGGIDEAVEEVDGVRLGGESECSSESASCKDSIADGA